MRGVARRHGTLAPTVLGDAKGAADLGEDFGNGLTAREVDYFVREEWARSADDVLWRRTKCGLGMTDAQSARVWRPASRERVAATGVTRCRAGVDAAARGDARCDARRAIRGVLTDIDDTLSTHGRLTADAYAALERLRAAGKLVIPITGRPAGWCDHIARMWPVDAVVGENGAFYMRYDARGAQARQALRRRRADARGANRARLAGDRREDPRRGARRALASDQLYREADLAIDFREDVPELPRAAVDRIVALMEAEGHDREGELDPRQRLVRRATTSCR